MKKLLVLAIVLLSGCNTLKRLLGEDPSPTPTISDIIIKDSIAQTDHDCVDIRCLDSFIGVQIKVNNIWVALNTFEYSVSTQGAGGGGITFTNTVYPTYNSDRQLIYLVLTYQPSVPKGTEYRITSTLKNVASIY